MKKETKEAIEVALARAESAFAHGARFGSLSRDIGTDWEGMLRDVREAQRLANKEPTDDL
jgi:hypothetical protein